MKEYDEAVYRQLYNVVLNGRKENGNNFFVSEDNLIRYADSEPDRVNVGYYNDVSSEDYEDNLFLLITRRVLDDNTRKSLLSLRESSEEGQYKKDVIGLLERTPERTMKKMKMFNYISEDENGGQKAKHVSFLKNTFMRKISQNKCYQKVVAFLYFKIYLKLPKGTKKIMKKIRGRLAN